MKDLYSLLKVFGRIKSRRIKYCGILTFHLLRRRYLGLFLDPVKICNLKCRMCYFSGEEGKHPNRNKMSIEEYRQIAKAIFHRLLKLQIGCGAEPTMYKDLPELVRIGKEFHVPYISLTTNGNLLTEDKLEELAAAGLDELTLSTHGLRRETYEFLMQNAKFDKFTHLLADFRSVHTKYPQLRLRINYTVNEDNIEELADFPKIFDGVPVSILQVRPVQDLGDSEYKNFSMTKILRLYDNVFPMLQKYCEEHEITFMFPTKENISILEKDTAHTTEDIMDYLHIYAYPGHLHHDDFKYQCETFDQYCKRTGYLRTLLRDIVSFKKRQGADLRTKPLNYNIKN